MLNDFNKSLEQKVFHKMIVGAALKDFRTIEELSYIFTHAAANAVDISAFPNSVIYAKKGIQSALAEDPNLEEPLLMISVNIGEDPHFRRVVVDWNNCTECLACIPSCPAEAFYRPETSEGDFAYAIDLCYGCSNCLSYCDYDALHFEEWDSFDINSLKQLNKLGANAIEIHLNNDLNAFKKIYQQMPDCFLLESFCIGSGQMSEVELTNALDTVIESVSEKTQFSKSIIIQADGLAISGAFANNDDTKDQSSIENAKLILQKIEHKYQEYATKIFVQLAGGATESTLSKAIRENVLASGVAIGSYARKKIKSLDSDKDKILFGKDLINRSKSLEKNIKK